jgi:hypothetical protein
MELLEVLISPRKGPLNILKPAKALRVRSQSKR